MKISLLILLVTVSVIGLDQISFAEMQGMSLTAEASQGTDFIQVRGQTASQSEDIRFTVISPDGFNVLAADQVSPDAQGFFSTKFSIGPSWNQDGFYTITAMQGVRSNPLYTISVSVEVIDGLAQETLVTESNLETGIYVPEHEGTPKEKLVLFVDAIEGTTRINLTGFSDRTNLDIALKVIAPNGNVVSNEQVTPDLDGKFTREITTGGPLWNQDGIYTITVQQGESSEYRDSEDVEIVDGVIVSGTKSTPQDPPYTPPRPPSSGMILVTIQGDSVFYLDSPNAIIRGDVKILDFSPSDGLYFMKVTHVPTQKTLKDFEIYPKNLGDDIWGTQIAYSILDTDIQYGGQTLYGEFQIDVTSESGKTGGTSFFIFESQETDEPPAPKVSEWIKNNAAWWAEGLIDDQTFVSGIQFLIKEKILDVPITQRNSNTESGVPEWIKNNADWWSQGLISENDFLKGIEYLVQNGIIDVSEKTEEIDKIADENQYEPSPREWQISGPFSIDRKQYALGEKIFIKIEGLQPHEKGELVVMRPIDAVHYSNYLTVPFDGSQKDSFNYYIEPQLSKTRGLCSVDDVLGEWAIVPTGTTYSILKFDIIDVKVPGTDWEPVC
jgi:hypothetical protein